MLFRTAHRRSLQAVLAGCLALAVLLIAPSAAQAKGCKYPSKIATSTSVSATPTIVQRGKTETITVTVTSGAGTPTGKVRLTIDGHGFATLQLHNGTASHRAPTGKLGTHTVVATYEGNCRYAGSKGTTAYTVETRAQILGLSGRRGNGNGNNRGPAVLGTGANSGGGATGVLVNTGLDNRTELLGLTGLALVVLGAAGIAVGRRRSHT